MPCNRTSIRITITGSGKDIKPIAITYVPGRLRERSSHLDEQPSVQCSSNGGCVHRFGLPDANRGHYIGSAVLMAQFPIARNFTAIPVDAHLFADSFNESRAAGYLVNIRTEALLFTVPTADFSMPNNVICLTCRVVALVFGPNHNFSTKKLRFAKKENQQIAGHPIIQIIKMFIEQLKPNCIRFVIFVWYLRCHTLINKYTYHLLQVWVHVIPVEIILEKNIEMRFVIVENHFVK